MRKLLSLLFFIFTCACVWAQDAPSASGLPSCVIIAKDSTSFADISDDEFYEKSSSVIFSVGSSWIPLNNPFIETYRTDVLPYANEHHLQLQKVIIRGAASPEGTYANNRILGQKRSKALVAQLQRDLLYQYGDATVEISCVTEDYGYLARLMKDAGDKDYETVRDIFLECGNDDACCKTRLIHTDGGRLWKRIYKEYFPKLRAARVMLLFTDSSSAPEPKVTLPDSADVLPTPEPEVTVPDEPAGQVIVPEVNVDDAKPSVRRHVVAVRTNLVHDFFYMPKYGWAPTPNIQLEFYPWNGHLTFNMGISWMTRRDWDSHRFYQVRDFQLEMRRYFRGGGRHLGFYLGTAAELTVYGIGLNKQEGWEGEGAGISLTGGYVMPLTRRKNLRLEFMLAAGYFLTRHDPYVYGNPVTGNENGKYYYNYLGTAAKFNKRNHTLSWLGPTNVGIQLAYDILYRHRSKVQKRIDQGKLKKENCY